MFMRPKMAERRPGGLRDGPASCRTILAVEALLAVKSTVTRFAVQEWLDLV